MGGRGSKLSDVHLGQVPPGSTSVFGDAFVVQGSPALLHLKAKFFSHEQWTIVDKNNGDKAVFSVDSRTRGKDERNTLLDATGKPVCMIKGKMMSMDDNQHIHRVNPDGSPGEELFQMKSNFGNTKQESVGLKNSSGQAFQICGKMSFTSMQGYLVYGDLKTGTAVAKVGQPKHFGAVASGSWTDSDYFLEIAPGVDMAVILAMVVAYEQMEQNYAMM